MVPLRNQLGYIDRTRWLQMAVAYHHITSIISDFTHSMELDPHDSLHRHIIACRSVLIECLRKFALEDEHRHMINTWKNILDGWPAAMNAGTFRGTSTGSHINFVLGCISSHLQTMPTPAAVERFSGWMADTTMEVLMGEVERLINTTKVSETQLRIAEGKSSNKENHEPALHWN
ncbi:hypothetical protein BO78DRAFT_385684 [Aspergillus sclerotiicarbonarius CBS 121057]|uniref:Uncharacterized protein n=1 Tax=Aspergillus sclerotiicarbonarius (strain CBS 121057 / IBT 28362) TaxID=1448318 RepID=A0A319EC07_ASPSB|nr:hypothetical protein BO78DRAFT_385684 [Aspergillus sclerotiicarbonarius CBS 121057]